MIRDNISTDIPALIRANIANLQDEAEAKQAVVEISKQQGRNPLSSKKEDIEEVGILNFFQNITLRQYKAQQIDEILNSLRKLRLR